MALSEMAARKAKATGKAYSLADYDGLSLFVTYKGGNSWHFRYYWAGKPARISLGTYPEVTLHDARALRDEARALVAKGLNPRTDRKRKQLAAMLTGEHTFMAVYEKWRDRKSVVLGKNVEVRVDLGGRRLRKKKRNNRMTTNREK